MSVDDPPREYLCSGTAEVADRRELAPPGELAVRWERRVDTEILWLTGTLDRATSALLERELDARANPLKRLVVNLAGLEFIDSSGLDTLTRAHRRARETGRRLSIERSYNVSRLLELSSHAERCPGPTTDPGAANNDPYYFALAIACADVDHQPPLGDRFRGGPDRPRTQRQPRAAPPLPSPARAAPVLTSMDRGINPPVVGTHRVNAVDCLQHPGYDKDPSPIARLPIRVDNNPTPAA